MTLVDFSCDEIAVLMRAVQEYRETARDESCDASETLFEKLNMAYHNFRLDKAKETIIR